MLWTNSFLQGNPALQFRQLRLIPFMETLSFCSASQQINPTLNCQFSSDDNGLLKFSLFNAATVSDKMVAVVLHALLCSEWTWMTLTVSLPMSYLKVSLTMWKKKNKNSALSHSTLKRQYGMSLFSKGMICDSVDIIPICLSQLKALAVCCFQTKYRKLEPSLASTSRVCLCI